VADRVQYFIDLQGADRAAANLGEMGNAAQRAERDLKGVGDAAGNASHELKRVEDGAGETDSILQGLAGALELVSPELADMARVAGDAAGGLEAVSRAGPRLAAVLGPVGIAIAAGALIWRNYADAAREAEEAVESAAEKSARVAAALSNLEQLETLQSIRAGIASGELNESALLGLQAQSTVDDAINPLKAHLQTGLNDSLKTERDLRAEIERLSHGSIAEQRKGVDKQQELVNIQRVMISQREQLAALEEKGAAMLQAELELLSGEAGLLDGATGTGTGGTGSDGWTDGGLLNKLTDPGAISGTSVDSGFSGLTAALDFGDFSLLERAQARASRFQHDNPNAVPGAQAGAGALGGLATGNVNPLLSLIPGGGLLGGVANVGTLGADGVGDMLDTFTEAVRTGIEDLPEILSEIIPDFAVSLVTELIPALIASAPQIFASLVKGIVSGLYEILAPGERGRTVLDAAGITSGASAGQLIDDFESGALLTNALESSKRSTRTSSSITRPQAPLRAGPGGGEVRVILGGDLGQLIDRIDIERGPNGTRPGSG